MNRGRARQAIFHNQDHYEAYLETPKANLGRIMHHVNGVFTQRYNRMRKTDGPLFRGRYKSILVDEDAYLLQLSRYIHRNPIEMKKPVTSLTKCHSD